MTGSARDNPSSESDVSNSAVSDDLRNATSRVMPPRSAAVDQLIRWLSELRAHHPTQSLGELIDSSSIPLDSLVELACVDLIGMRRLQHDVSVESYLDQFPVIAPSEDHILDLIDAELCVRRELGDDRGVEFYADRFPQLANSIKQLMFLESSSPLVEHRAAENDVDIDISPIGSNGSVDIPASKNRGRDKSQSPKATMELAPEKPQKAIGSKPVLASDSNDFSLHRDMTLANGRAHAIPQEPDRGHDDSIDVVIPIQPPAWMVGARCIATSVTELGRGWLVKGRDTERGDTVAMKVLPLPPTIGRETRTRMLDMCEQTSSVTHDTWIAPRIAAINNGHLAVVRPWVFGQTLERISRSDDDLAMIPRAAFALSAAHRVGATHGSVTPCNLIIDHERNIRLIDAASGAQGWVETWKSWNNDLQQSLPDRIRVDTIGLVQLIVAKCAIPNPHHRLEWIESIARDVDFAEPHACALIGENLQGLLDEGPKKKRWWR